MTMQHPEGVRRLAIAAFLTPSALVIITVAAWGTTILIIRRHQATVQASNNGIGGFPLSGRPAPDFKLTDQFGQTVSLSSLRGREVVLAFIDARCTTLCPLTAEILYDATGQIGSTADNPLTVV